MEEKQGSFVRVNVIVDSNIVFSSLLLSESTFGDLLLHSDFCFQFHSALHLKTEIEKHWTRIVRISKLSETNLEIAKALLFNKISFHSERQISAETWLWAENMVREIDEDDIDFVALTRHLKGHLWTGDKILQAGLRIRKFHDVLTTSELLLLRESLR